MYKAMRRWCSVITTPCRCGRFYFLHSCRGLQSCILETKTEGVLKGREDSISSRSKMLASKVGSSSTHRHVIR